MRNLLVVGLTLLSWGLVLGQSLKVSAGRALFYYNASDTMNMNSAFNIVGLDFNPTWLIRNGKFSLLSENSLLRDDESSGNGFGLNTRLGAYFMKSVSTHTELGLTASYWLTLNPSYDQANDSRTIEVYGSGETEFNSATYLRYSVEYDRLDYPNNTAASGDVFEASSEISRSFASGRSLRWQLSSGTKQYDRSGTPLVVGSRLQLGQSLGDARGLSLVGEAGTVFGAVSAVVTQSSFSNAVVDPYTYDKLGAGLKFKMLTTRNRFLISYGFEWRDFQGMQRTDKIHSAGLEWTAYVNGKEGKKPIGLSVEPSARLTQSTVNSENFLAVYLMLGVEL